MVETIVFKYDKKQLILLNFMTFPLFGLHLQFSISLPISLSPSFLLHLSPCPYKNRQNLLSLPIKNFKISSFPSFSRETNRNPKPNSKKIHRRESPKEQLATKATRKTSLWTRAKLLKLRLLRACKQFKFLSIWLFMIGIMFFFFIQNNTT